VLLDELELLELVELLELLEELELDEELVAVPSASTQPLALHHTGFPSVVSK